MLDSIMEQSLVTGSSCRKRRRRSANHDNVDVICKGENSLSFISSLLDVLLYKKDIVNRFVFSIASSSGRLVSNVWLMVFHKRRWLQG